MSKLADSDGKAPHTIQSVSSQRRRDSRIHIGPHNNQTVPDEQHLHLFYISQAVDMFHLMVVLAKAVPCGM